MDEFEHQPTSEAERRALFLACVLNIALSAALVLMGVLASSSGLIANALDNASDAVAYAISFSAVRRERRWKTRAAKLSGATLLIVAVGVMLDAVRRVIEGSEPIGRAMLAMAVVAAAVNVACLRLLSAHRGGDVNLRAAWTFSINDLVSNLGVLVAGVLVLWLGRAWPDLLIGLLIAAFAARGGVRILVDARRAQRGEA